MKPEDIHSALETVLVEAKKAGAIIRNVRQSKELRTEDKSSSESDDSFDPVTVADKRSNAYLCSRLHELFPSYGLLTEEEIEEEFLPDEEIRNSVKEAIEGWGNREYAWLIDPLDGTKEFVKETSNYCVLIGLLHNARPIGGVIYVPESDEVMFGGESCGVYHNGKPFTRSRSASVFIGAEHEGVTLEGYELRQRPSCLGISVLNVIKGDAHAMCYRRGKSSLWDTCAPQAILEAVGGKITDCSGEPLKYTPATIKNINGVIASINSHDELVAACAAVRQGIE